MYDINFHILMDEFTGSLDCRTLDLEHSFGFHKSNLPIEIIGCAYPHIAVNVTQSVFVRFASMNRVTIDLLNSLFYFAL